MPYKGGVQLLPETQRRPSLRSYTTGNKYFYFAVALGAAILVISATLGGYKASLIKDIDRIDGELSVSEKSRNKEAEKELINASKQSQIIKQLLVNKLYWSQALERMQQMMRTSVRLTRLDANAGKGVITFQAATDSYASVARQIAAFVEATGVKDIAVTSIEATQDGTVEFDGELTIDTKEMLQKFQTSPSVTPRPSPTPTP